MTSLERDAIMTPAEGLLVYGTNTKTFWVYQGSDWQQMSGTELSDANNDTKVEVERTADEDIIHIQVGGNEKVTINDTLALIQSSLELGGNSGDGISQLNIGGNFNAGVNQGSFTGTYKLRISNYNNDNSEVVYPIYAIDEYFNVDFSIKNRDLLAATPSIGYFAGDVGIGIESPAANLHLVDNSTLGSIIVAPNELGNGDNAEIFLAEDHDATLGMKFLYDGSDNQLGIYGKTASTLNRPHMLINRDNGNMAIGTSGFASGFRYFLKFTSGLSFDYWFKF